MRHPKSLETLVEHGIIEEVIRPLMSGKEAQVYLVASQEGLCAAKIYKDAEHRSFKNRADYTEGRTVRNSRDQRAIAKRSKYGKGKDEEAWKSTEVDMIYRLREGGVRVPTPYVYIDGVLLMELVVDGNGHPAPRLGDLEFTPQEATEVFHHLLAEVVRMLCIGVVHGDFSEFNVLYGSDGPVVIDFPQSINASGNLSARKLLIRDVDNLHRFLARWVPGARRRPYAEEMWALYEENRLTPETELTGRFQQSRGPVDTSEVLALIGDADRDENRRRLNAGGKPVGEIPVGTSAEPIKFRRREVIVERPAPRPARSMAGGVAGRPTGARSDASQRGTGSRSDAGQRGASPRGDHRGPPARPGAPAYTRPENRKNSGPKRGDVVQNSTYVSPEARKLHPKALALTPRDSGAPSGAARRPGQGSQGDNQRGGGNPRDRERGAPRDRSASADRGAPRDRSASADRGAPRDRSPSADRGAPRERDRAPHPDVGFGGNGTRSRNGAEARDERVPRGSPPLVRGSNNGAPADRPRAQRPVVSTTHSSAPGESSEEPRRRRRNRSAGPRS